MDMVVAIGMVRRSFEFFMNGTGAHKGEGIEYHLPVVGMTAFLMIREAAAFSVDRAMTTGTDRSRSGLRLTD